MQCISDGVTNKFKVNYVRTNIKSICLSVKGVKMWNALTSHNTLRKISSLVCRFRNCEKHVCKICFSFPFFWWN